MSLRLLRHFHNNLTMDSRVSDIPLNKYPRPELRRDSFLSLNGKWEDGTLVPFPLEAPIQKKAGNAGKEYIYTRHFTLPKDFIKGPVLLHFGAVDQIADVYVNDSFLGHHEGGYLPFEFDIANLVREEVPARLTVKVKDTLSKKYPYGKQKKHPRGMWYTEVSGIWQSVWIESVPVNYIEAIEITPYLDHIHVEVYPENSDYNVEIRFKNEAVFDGCFDIGSFDINIENPLLWTPETPNLYDITISNGIDKIESYFGLRTLSVKEINGIPRILLNNEPYFFHGVLDQGYFPDGIYTPNCEEDYEKDILNLKELGFNTIRKHIKIEPSCFYEACDRLGMIVFQDMVNNGKYSFLRDTAMPTLFEKTRKRNDSDKRINDQVKYQFEASMEGTLARLYNFPCICYYTIFNEGWGQFDSDIMVSILSAMDQTRIVDATSGWFMNEDSDVESIHKYFKPFVFEPAQRPVILSEAGGFSYIVKGHTFSKFANYGYGKEKSGEALTQRIEAFYYNEIIPSIKQGLCGVIYTQLTDVEEETNGLFTYDRKVCKVNKQNMKKISEVIRQESSLH